VKESYVVREELVRSKVLVQDAPQRGNGDLLIKGKERAWSSTQNKGFAREPGGQGKSYPPRAARRKKKKKVVSTPHRRTTRDFEKALMMGRSSPPLPHQPTHEKAEWISRGGRYRKRESD